MRHITLILVIAGSVVLAGCAGNGGSSTESDLRGNFKQAGSSTVLPVAQAWAEAFGGMHRDVQLVVSGGGTGSGFNQFCRGEIDIADASRPIKAEEQAACAAAGIEPFEIQVAIDALAVVVSRQNDFVDHLTVEELNRIWTADASKQANRWSELRPEWPNERIERFGPGTDSGTFDYFIEVIIQPFDGKESKGRSDYTPSEDDNVLVQGVAPSRYAIGYFGYAYVHENADKIRAIAIDEGKGKGPIEPSGETVAAGDYTPLARPIFMYTKGAPTGALQEYFRFGLGEEGQALVEEVGYLRLPADRLNAMREKVG
ncbi:MAG TPA: PstS family phosphate ABC transporter substrate-binding protein [Candidatus Thermoplasmatota archaeon]|nr:PstS family phosphate ABC transporter substrate-binding protein [Candidatus Thermoplasmatota archaeon]